jgi:long-chain acyl-CoA synthetase
VRRPLTGEDPDQLPPTAGWFFELFGLAPLDDHVHLCCSPLYHTAVLNFATISLQLGHPVVLMDHFEPEALLALVERHRVTHTHMVPTQFARLLALPQSTRDRYDVSSLRCVIHSAAPCPPEVKRQMIQWWGPVTEYYAASEGGGTAITAQDWLTHPGSVGTPWLGTEVRVLDDEATTHRPASRAWSTCAWAPRPSTTTRTRRRPGLPGPGACSPSGTSVTWTPAATRTCATARAT